MKAACQAMIVAGLFVGLSFVVAFGLALADTSDWRASLAVMRGDELIVPARVERTADSDGLIAIPVHNLGDRPEKILGVQACCGIAPMDRFPI